jgi:hypothetical protein
MVTYEDLINSFDGLMTRCYDTIHLIERGDATHCYTVAELNEFHRKAEMYDRRIGFLVTICQKRDRGRDSGDSLFDITSQKVIDRLQEIK